MRLSNDIVLRPRFKKILKQSNESALRAFEEAKTNQSNYIITRVDDHVFIKFPKQRLHYWSPQLHLEITSKEESESELSGLFGPSPAVWTLFMFFHFLVATLFVGSLVWAYSNYSLGNRYSLQLLLMGLLVLSWFILYFIGKMGKATGRKEMHELHDFMCKVLNI